jgi:hypothetical protein
MAAFETDMELMRAAQAKDFDWSSVGLFSDALPVGSVAFQRCLVHPDLKKLRERASKDVIAAFDALLLPRGFQRQDGLRWAKAGSPPPQEKSRPPADAARPGLFQRLLGLGPKLKTAGRDTAAHVLPLPHPVYIELQKDRRGFCFYVNLAVGSDALKLAADMIYDGDGDGFRAFRIGRLMPELKPIESIDQLHYVRWIEQPAFRALILDVIEHRALPWLEAWASAKPIALKPLPGELARSKPLPHLFEKRP